VKLSRRTRRVLVLLHVLTSMSWIGVDLVIGVLSFTGLSTDDPRTMATAYGGLALFAVPLLLALGLGTLATGILLGLGTRFGLLRYWWVVVKLVISVVLTVLVIVALRPTLGEAAVETSTVDPTLADRLADVRLTMVFPPLVSTTALVVTAWLGVFKPWGPTRLGRDRGAAATRRGERARVAQR
jgi:hypothetical protein